MQLLGLLPSYDIFSNFLLYHLFYFMYFIFIYMHVYQIRIILILCLTLIFIFYNPVMMSLLISYNCSRAGSG